MRKIRDAKGFTLIELVIIILILGILAATAIPKFVDLSTKAKQASERGVVGAVRGGIAIAYASNLLNGVTSYPADLGGALAAAGSANILFSNVLNPGIDADWTRLAGNSFTGPAGGTYTYTAASGTFQ